MKLYDLIPKKDVLSGAEYMSLDVSAITDDSRKVKAGGAFFAFVKNADHISEAYRRGAAVIVAESAVGVGLPCVAVENVRHSYAAACLYAHGSPEKKMKLVAVTGTNGKTSVSTMVSHILAFAGHKVALIGTTGNYIAGEFFPASYTTPPPDLLAELLDKAAQAGCSHAVMEASSHALCQHRTDGLTFDVGIFTNLTRDHMDYHKTEDDYAAAKARLFESSKSSVINFDDARAEQMAWHAAGDVYYVSLSSPRAEYFAHDVDPGMSKLNFTLETPRGAAEIRTSLTGGFNVLNAAEAFAAAEILGVEKDKITAALADFRGVAGRAEQAGNGEISVIIDYAHTPDALEKVLMALRPLTAGKLITVFGCGGDRDRGKRPMMGAVAAKYSDITVITSDNPRTEDPEKIIGEIAVGVPREKPTEKIPDRADAIRRALSLANRGDTVLIAGKGHEDYIVDARGKRYFSDRDEVIKYFEKGK